MDSVKINRLLDRLESKANFRRGGSLSELTKQLEDLLKEASIVWTKIAGVENDKMRGRYRD